MGVMLTGWRYYYRRYLGWLPIQFCYICGRAFWAGFPSCWNWRTWRFDWQPGMSDYCSRKCCDEDLEMCEAMSPLTTCATSIETCPESIDEILALMRRIREEYPPAEMLTKVIAGRGNGRGS